MSLSRYARRTRCDEPAYGRVERREERILLTRERVVERAPGHARGARDLLDAHRGVAGQARHIGDRIEDALPLIGLDVVPRKLVPPGRQLMRSACTRLSLCRHPVNIHVYGDLTFDTPVSGVGFDSNSLTVDPRMPDCDAIANTIV